MRDLGRNRAPAPVKTYVQDRDAWTDREFLNDLPQHGRQRLIGITIQGQAAAETPAREIEQVGYQILHAGGTIPYQPGHGRRILVELFLEKQLRQAFDGPRRIAEIVAEHGDKLFPQLGYLTLLNKGGFGGGEFPIRIKVFADELGEEPEHPDGRRRLSGEPGRGSMAHSVPKKEPSARMIGIEI